MTLLILFMILCIFFSLGSGLYYLVKDGGRTRRVVRALAIRIILSFILFIALLISFALGWISPHDLTSVPKESSQSGPVSRLDRFETNFDIIYTVMMQMQKDPICKTG